MDAPFTDLRMETPCFVCMGQVAWAAFSLDTFFVAVDLNRLERFNTREAPPEG